MVKRNTYKRIEILIDEVAHLPSWEKHGDKWLIPFDNFRAEISGIADRSSIVGLGITDDGNTRYQELGDHYGVLASETLSAILDKIKKPEV